jgi:predicted nucleic acid-binding protein
VEYEATCSQAEHRLAAGVSAADVVVFLDAIVAMAVEVETHYLWRGRLRDPNDEMVLDAAINGHANAIATFNQRDFGQVPHEFDIDVILPRDVIRRTTT